MLCFDVEIVWVRKVVLSRKLSLTLNLGLSQVYGDFGGVFFFFFFFFFLNTVL